MNKPSTQNRPRNPLVPLLYLAPVAILLILAIFLWRGLANQKNLLEDLSARNSKLQQQLASAKAEIDDFNSGDSSAATRERLAAERASAKPTPAKEEIETLFLQSPTVEQVAGDLVARFRFDPGNDTELPETITLVVRIPGNTESKILSLKPASEADYSNIMYVVNANGDLGMIEGSPSDLSVLVFELTVSAPVKAIVRGSEGIKDFELDITPDGCNVRKL